VVEVMLSCIVSSVKEVFSGLAEKTSLSSFVSDLSQSVWHGRPYKLICNIVNWVH
jgi:hypothetical protein